MPAHQEPNGTTRKQARQATYNGNSQHKVAQPATHAVGILIRSLQNDPSKHLENKACEKQNAHLY